MKTQLFKNYLLSISFLLIVGNFACNRTANSKTTDSLKTTISSSIQTSAIKKIDTTKTSTFSGRPEKSSITNPTFPEKDFLGAWAVDLSGPSANFELNKEFYFMVDYDGNGDMPYTIQGDSIIVYFVDYTTKGQIRKAQNDSLAIAWDNQEPTVYLRWNK